MCILYKYKGTLLQLIFSFVQWQYHSQWGLSESWLLLIENYTQYFVTTTWNMVGKHNFWKLLWKLKSIYTTVGSESWIGPTYHTA